MSYLFGLPSSTSFCGKGLFGYSFGSMKQKDLEVLYIESETGHDTFMILRGVTRIYYILAGTGSFTIGGRVHNVSAGVLIEIPSGVEYTYSGRMTMLAFCRKSRFARKDTFTRWNRDVVGEEAPYSLNDVSRLSRLLRLRIFGKSPTNAFLRVNRHVWNALPPSLIRFRPFEWYGHFLHKLVRIQDIRAQAFNTFFLRNRPQLELMRRLVSGKGTAETVRVAVLGCSTGAEVYSIVWAIRTARPDLKLIVDAVDVSRDVVEFARRGIYPLRAKMTINVVRDCMAAGYWRVGELGSDLVDSEIFERMTEAEKGQFFNLTQDSAVVKDWLKKDINWAVADVRDPGIVDRFELQDIVVASNFLCHMENSEADRCLRNIARLVCPEGHLFVSGIDLQVRKRIVQDLGWQPVTELLDEIHDGDPCLRRQWPFQYAGLEPLNKRWQGWETRYAAAFRVLPEKDGSRSGNHGALEREVEVHGAMAYRNLQYRR